jgi:hypothetical protein
MLTFKSEKMSKFFKDLFTDSDKEDKIDFMPKRANQK